jgi:cobalt-zinc-cadmium efflux system membrane fusion protein
VPEGSPYRTRISVAPVEQKEIRRTLVLPATVEADPVLTLNILPPLTGRIVELKVRLGDEVTQGQTVAVLDSGDLAQVLSDTEKARDGVVRTKKR